MKDILLKIHIALYNLFDLFLNYRVNNIDSYRAMVKEINQFMKQDSLELQLANYICEHKQFVCRYKYQQAIRRLQKEHPNPYTVYLKPIKFSVCQEISDAISTL